MKLLLIIALAPIGVLSFPGSGKIDTSGLQPVQGIFIKKSEDGTSGDLYVAASEDNGTTTPWISEKSVTILPSGQQAQPEQQKMDYQYDQAAFMKNNFYWPQHTHQEQEDEKPKVELIVMDPSQKYNEKESTANSIYTNPSPYPLNGMPYPFPPYGFPFPPPFYFMPPFFPQMPPQQVPDKVPEQVKPTA